MNPRRTATELDHLHEHIERIWERLTQGGPAIPGFCPPGLEPPADVLVTPEEIIVRVEIAGLRGSELDVEVAGSRLTLRGTKQEPPRPPQAEYAQMEIMGGTFERSLTLPAGVNPEAASVEYSNGYLTIRLPRERTLPDRHIRVPVRRI
ncbi:MAG: Hsp20/alpha crystallin family protein [Dehalococcoidia bacterium]